MVSESLENTISKGTDGNNGNRRGTEKARKDVFSEKMVRSPGFEPGSSGWEPDVLARLD